jgi:hypothetical protein
MLHRNTSIQDRFVSYFDLVMGIKKDFNDDIKSFKNFQVKLLKYIQAIYD